MRTSRPVPADQPEEEERLPSRGHDRRPVGALEGRVRISTIFSGSTPSSASRPTEPAVSATTRSTAAKTSRQASTWLAVRCGSTSWAVSTVGHLFATRRSQKRSKRGKPSHWTCATSGASFSMRRTPRRALGVYSAPLRKTPARVRFPSLQQAAGERQIDLLAHVALRFGRGPVHEGDANRRTVCPRRARAAERAWSYGSVQLGRPSTTTSTPRC